MARNKFSSVKLSAGILLLTTSLVLPVSSVAAQDVKVISDNQGWKLQVDGKDFFVKGVVWGYTPRAENYTYNLWGQSDEFIKQVLDYEFGLMQAAGINAIRTFMMIPPKWVEYVYHNYGIMTAVNPLMGRYGVSVNGRWTPNTDYSDPATRKALKQEVLAVVESFKDTDGVLMFALGNESNYGLSWQSFEIENLPVGQQNQAKARYLYSLFAEVIDEARGLAPHVPFTIVNGDIQYLDLITEFGQNWDLLGTNVYRGQGFTDLWRDVKNNYGKPILFFEFGADAFNAKTYREDERAQAQYLKSQWREIYAKAYGNGAEGNALGGFVFEWRDEWWKYQQTQNLNVHDKNASWSNGGYEYDFQQNANNMNEEWWGINRLGKANREGVYVAETRLALDVLTEVWKADPFDANQTAQVFSSINFEDLATYRAANTERSDRLFGNDVFKMTGARIRAETTSRGLGGEISDKGQDGWRHDSGVMGFADFAFEPSANFNSRFTINYTPKQAESDFEFRYGDRINADNDPKLEVYDFEAHLDSRYFNLNAFYHIPRYHWGYEGDFFGLVHESTDRTGPNGQDIWNAKAPVGFELNGKGSLGGLTVLAGPQVYWGANPKAIVRYRFGEGQRYSIMHAQDYERSTDNDGASATSRQNAQTTIQGQFNLGKAELQLGVIAAGRDRVGERYQYVKDGVITSEEINTPDTFGVKGKLSLPFESGSTGYIAGQYAGLVADAGAPLVEMGSRLPYSGMGNKFELEAGFLYVDGPWSLFPRTLVRRNLVGANVGLRSRNTEDDPFAVLSNRRVNAAELILTYDPTPATPFYAWDNHLREDAKLAFNLGATYMDYGWPTDAYRAFFDDQNFTGEGAFASGLEADELWVLFSKIVINPSAHFRGVLRLDVGREQTTGNPIGATNFTSFEAKGIFKNRHIVTAYLAQDKWGPYDFQRQFGLIYPEQYKLGYSYLLDKGVAEDYASKVGIKLFYRTLDDQGVALPEYTMNGYTNRDMYEIQTYIEYRF